MKKSRKYIPILVIVLSAVLVIAVEYGCNGSSSVITPDEVYKYRLEGVVIKDLNIDTNRVDSTRIAIKLERNDTLLNNAQIMFDGNSLLFNDSLFVLDSVYSFSTTPMSLVAPDTYNVEVVDPSKFTDTLTTIIIDTFSIIQVIPENPIPSNGDQVKLDWRSASNIEGYIIAAVLRDSAYTGYGYSMYATSLAPQETFQPEAFRLTNPDEPDTGWYYLYVYGYTGAPDSALSSKLLPVPIPSQLVDNINLIDLKGRFGSIVVVKQDSVRIALSPP